MDFCKILTLTFMAITLTFHVKNSNVFTLGTYFCLAEHHLHIVFFLPQNYSQEKKKKNKKKTKKTKKKKKKKTHLEHMNTTPIMTVTLMMMINKYSRLSLSRIPKDSLNTWRYPYLDISDLQNLGKNESNCHI